LKKHLEINMKEERIVLIKDMDIGGLYCGVGTILTHEPKTHIIMIEQKNLNIPYVFLPHNSDKSKIECDLYWENILKLNK
jgi:hypothetical protein